MYVHPKERKFRKPIDAILKISDILYELKKGDIDENIAKKKVVFIKAVVKGKNTKEEFINQLGEEGYEKFLENLDEEINYAKELIEKFGKLAYDKYIQRMKKKWKDAIKELEKATKSSLLAFIGGKQ